MSLEGNVRFTRSDLFAGLILGVVLLGLLLPVTASTRAGAKRRDCINNLKHLGMQLTVYVEKYGSGKDFPPGGGASTIFSSMRGVPNPKDSVTIGNEKTYTCAVWGGTSPVTGTSSSGIDYASYDGISPGAMWPGSRLADGAPPGLVIAADPQENHGGKTRRNCWFQREVDDGNFLYFDGHVETKLITDMTVGAYGAKNLSGATHSFP